MENRSGISKIIALVIVAAVVAAGFGMQWWFNNRYLPAKRGDVPISSSSKNKNKQGTKSNSVPTASVCTGITGVAALNCITKAAEQSKNASLCETLTQRVGGELPAARDYCISRVALQTGDVNSCNSIKNAQLKNECYLAAADAKDNGDICKKIASFEMREDCFVRIAKQTLDLRYCANIQTRERKEICNALALPYKKDPLYLCENRITDVSKNGCYREAAIAREDLSLCSKINTSLDRFSCITALAQMRNSREICDTIQDSLFRVTCYDAIKTFRN